MKVLGIILKVLFAGLLIIGTIVMNIIGAILCAVDRG